MEAYAATFPLPDGATVRRMNDNETAAAAGDLALAAGRFKRDLDKDGTLAKADKDAVGERQFLELAEQDDLALCVGKRLQRVLEPRHLFRDHREAERLTHGRG